jgi:hypothetical protein
MVARTILDAGQDRLVRLSLCAGSQGDSPSTLVRSQIGRSSMRWDFQGDAVDVSPAGFT